MGMELEMATKLAMAMATEMEPVTVMVTRQKASLT
jgi:hypothetical protein